MTTVTFHSEASSKDRSRQSERGGVKTPRDRPLRPLTDTRFTRIHQHPWENRKALSENYEDPVSGREGWWRTHIRETPKPGSYEHPTFIEEMSQRPNTYRFKSDGRKVDPNPHGKGAVLLPGAYESEDFLQSLDKKPTPATYSFKVANRDGFDVLNFGKKDKAINVSPNAYRVEDYLTLTTERMPSKHSMFKSQAKRFPTVYFKPTRRFQISVSPIPDCVFRSLFALQKEGPAPGNYDSLSPTTPHVVSSSFKSKTPRFATSHTRVPGPGAYEKTFQFPIPQTVSKMGRQYGLFFTSAFQT